jgi:hypothetical protein
MFQLDSWPGSSPQWDMHPSQGAPNGYAVFNNVFTNNGDVFALDSTGQVHEDSAAFRLDYAQFHATSANG